MNNLLNISPIDGRYYNDTKEINNYFLHFTNENRHKIVFGFVNYEQLITNV